MVPEAPDFQFRRFLRRHTPSGMVSTAGLEEPQVSINSISALLAPSKCGCCVDHRELLKHKVPTSLHSLTGRPVLGLTLQYATFS